MLKKVLDDDVVSKTVVLLVTNSCNIDCVYCYEHFKNAHYMQLDKMIEIAETELNADNEFERIKIPVLVIAGTNDMVKRKHTRLIQSSIKNSRLVLIQGDHFIANRRTEEFNRSVLDFLDTT